VVTEQKPTAVSVYTNGTKRISEREMVVVIEGSTYESVSSPEAHDLAIQYAASIGFVNAGFNGMDDVYPVDEAGKAIDAPGPGIVARGWRNDLRLARL
jgi:hypothetical protein